jgi:hypothetical protein
MRPGPAQVEASDRHLISRPSGHRPQHEHLVEAHLAVKDVAAGDAETALQVERASAPAVDHQMDRILGIYSSM